MLDSVRSVEWKIDVKQNEASALSSKPVEKKQDLIKEEKNESDDDEILEEDISESVSPESKAKGGEEDSSDEEVDDDSDESSDLNTRDEMADLESCPEGVGQSQSLSGND